MLVAAMVAGPGRPVAVEQGAFTMIEDKVAEL